MTPSTDSSNQQTKEGDLNSKRQILLSGLSIQERIDNYKHSLFGESNSTTHQIDSAKLKAWQDVYSHDEGTGWNKRLEWDGINIYHAEAIASRQTESIDITPQWYQTLQTVRNYTKKNLQSTRYAFISEIANRTAFGHIWISACDWATKQLSKSIATTPLPSAIEESCWRSLVENLMERLTELSYQANFKLFNKIRPRELLYHRKYLNKLPTDQKLSSTYYDNYIGKMLQSGWASLMDNYPGLGRLIGLTLEQWITSAHELLLRIHNDRNEIAKLFEVENTFHIKHIKTGLGDRHDNGRSVCRITLQDSQKSVRLIYKPRSIKLETTYFEFINAINSKNIKTNRYVNLKSLKSLDRETHGFIEFLQSTKSKTDSDLREFYFNAGRLTAAMYLLGCTDCHYENFIAADNQLQLIDAETIMEPILNNQVTGEGRPETGAHAQLADSVLRLCMLPGSWLDVGKQRKPVEISCLGHDFTKFNHTTKRLVQINSDFMHFATVNAQITSNNSSPYDRNEGNRLANFKEDFLEGLREQLNIFIHHKTFFESQLINFKYLTRRIVPRPTHVYATMLRRLYKPEQQDSAFKMSISLEPLWRAYVIEDSKPHHLSMAKEEISQLHNLDIPYFCHKTNGFDLLSASKDTVVGNFIHKTGYDAAVERLNKLSPKLADFQLRLARGSIEAYSMSQSNEILTDSFAPIRHQYEARQIVLHEEWHQREAIRLAEIVWSQSIPNQSGSPEWIGVDLAVAQRRYKFGILDYNLYSGKIGLAVLFSRVALLYSKSDQHKERTLWIERAALTIQELINLMDGNGEVELRSMIKRMPIGMAGIGGLLTGLNCLIQSASLLNELTNQSRLELLRELLLQTFFDLHQQSNEFELLAGYAGLIGPLLKSSHTHAKNFAIKIGERLVQMQQDNGGWLRTDQTAYPPLIGFAHGTSSIALGLVRLYELNDNIQFLSAARKAINYERGCFNVHQNNWPDYRKSSKSDTFMKAWCSGSPGVILSRFGILNSPLGDEDCQAELSKGVAGLYHTGNVIQPQRYDHLCCGNLGICAILDFINNSFDGQLAEPVNHLESWVVARQNLQNGYYSLLTPTGAGIDSPSLFTGIAGIALYFAERARPLGFLRRILLADLDVTVA